MSIYHDICVLEDISNIMLRRIKSYCKKVSPKKI